MMININTVSLIKIIILDMAPRNFNQILTVLILLEWPCGCLASSPGCPPPPHSADPPPPYCRVPPAHASYGGVLITRRRQTCSWTPGTGAGSSSWVDPCLQGSEPHAPSWSLCQSWIYRCQISETCTNMEYTWLVSQSITQTKQHSL